MSQQVGLRKMALFFGCSKIFRLAIVIFFIHYTQADNCTCFFGNKLCLVGTVDNNNDSFAENRTEVSNIPANSTDLKQPSKDNASTTNSCLNGQEGHSEIVIARVTRNLSQHLVCHRLKDMYRLKDIYRFKHVCFCNENYKIIDLKSLRTFIGNSSSLHHKKCYKTNFPNLEQYYDCLCSSGTLYGTEKIVGRFRLQDENSNRRHTGVGMIAGTLAFLIICVLACVIALCSQTYEDQKIRNGDVQQSKKQSERMIYVT